jgi:hypothetical protein
MDELELHTQQIFDGANGDCLQAAIATALQLPIAAVPNFSPFRAGWFEAIQLWARNNGYALYGVDDPTKFADLRVIATGPAARGHQHAVVWQDDHMVHDPHPDRTGLVEVREYWAIEDLRGDER